MEKKKYKQLINIFKNNPDLTNNLRNAHYNETLIPVELLWSVQWTNTKQSESPWGWGECREMDLEDCQRAVKLVQPGVKSNLIIHIEPSEHHG